MSELPRISLTFRNRWTTMHRRDSEAIAACLFLDVDGTLLDFAEWPDAVRIDAALIELLRMVAAATDGAVALISGRSIATLDALFVPLQLPAAGLHGSERRGADGRLHQGGVAQHRLDPARQQLQTFVELNPEVRLEDKGSCLAVHYRGAPQAQAAVAAIMKRIVAALTPEFELLSGREVLELRPGSHTKGTAVETFLREKPFRGRRPIYLGDDVTDLAGFDAVRRHGGIDIAVGGHVSANWALSDPAAVRAWLTSLLPQKAVVA